MSDLILFSNEDAVRLRSLFSIQTILMKVFGQMKPQFENVFPASLKWLGIIASSLYYIFMILLTLHTAVLFAVTSLDTLKYGELEDITDALTMLVIFSFAAFASIYWIRRSADLELFFESINSNYEHHSLAGIFMPVVLFDGAFINVLIPTIYTGLTFVSARRSYDFARKVTCYWLFSCIFGVLFWALAPLMIHQRTFPLKCWYPFDAKKEYIYEVVYAIQIMAQFEMGGVFGNGSAVFVSIIATLLGQFDILFCSLKNVQAHSYLLIGANLETLQKKQDKLSLKEDELDQYIFSKEYKVDLNIYAIKNNGQTSKKALQLALQHSMKLCILHHQFILRSCAKLEELFNPYCLVKSMQITIQLCLLVFIGVASERSVVRSINLIGYLALTSTELFMFTYYGELLRRHSLRAGESLLRSPWHKNTYLIKKEILIFLTNTKKPIQITAGKFFIMDITRLRSVVTQAFSFLTLLQKIAAKKP